MLIQPASTASRSSEHGDALSDLQEWRALEKEAVQAVELAGELIPALTKAEEKAHLARITSDIAARSAPTTQTITFRWVDDAAPAVQQQAL